MASFISLVLLIGLFHGSAQACSTGWAGYKDSCYLIANRPESWPAASAFCQALNSRLVIIESADEDAFLRNETQLRSGTESYWIDGTDISSEGTWIWASTLQPLGLQAEYTNWHPGQPDDLNGQDCMSMYQPFGYNWDDGNCDTRQGFICELVDSGAGEGLIG